MGDAENAFPPSKKRAAGREISRDNPGLDEDDDASEQECGTFKKASDEVLAARKIVKVRRQQTPAAAASNPFAKISFVPTSTESAKPTEDAAEVQQVAEKPASGEVDAKKEGEDKGDKGPAMTDLNVEDTKSREKTDEKADEGEGDSAHEGEGDSAHEGEGDSVEKATNLEGKDEKETAGGEEAGEEAKKDNGPQEAVASASTASLSSFQQLSSSQNAFTGLAGTGFSDSTFSFGSTPKDGLGVGVGSGSVFGLSSDKPSFPSFNFGNSGNGGSSLFGTAGASSATKNEGSGIPSMQEVPVETGEENEKAVFTADAALFEYLEGGWKERGKGELKVNISTTGVERARLVMRARGNYRLILNARLYSDMKLTNMEKRGITFACMNSTGEGKGGLSTFALKFKDGSVVEEFRAAVTTHTGKKTAVLKTPENSP